MHYRMPAGFDAWLTTDRVADDADDRQREMNEACAEFYDDCAAEYVAQEWNGVLDMPAMEELVIRAGTAAQQPYSAGTSHDIGQDFLNIIRAYCQKHDAAITAACVKRLRSYQGDA